MTIVQLNMIGFYEAAAGRKFPVQLEESENVESGNFALLYVEAVDELTGWEAILCSQLLREYLLRTILK